MQDNATTKFTTSSASILSEVGFSSAFVGGFNANNGGNLLPSPGISGYANGGEIIENTPEATDSWEYSGTLSKTWGRHDLKFGGGFISNKFSSPISYPQLGFAARGDSESGGHQRRGYG